jgi:hypothetical protein
MDGVGVNEQRVGACALQAPEKLLTVDQLNATFLGLALRSRTELGAGHKESVAAGQAFAQQRSGKLPYLTDPD